MQPLKTSKARENILRKIRTGLSNAPLPVPFPEVEQQPTNRPVLAVPEGSPEEAFAIEFSRLGGKFVFCDTEQELAETIQHLSDRRGWRELLCADPQLLTRLQGHGLAAVLPAEQGTSTADACITGCEALIGRTGSVVFSSRQPLGRTAPVYYPVHLIVAYADQVTDDLPAALQQLRRRYGDQLPSMINLNTGPSRTADIEKTLVVGVHGPGEVFCILVNTR